MEKPKLKDIFEELVDVSANWKYIGLQLGVDYKKIENIRGADKDCLLEVLKKYLNGPQPSWEGIARALNTRSVEENELAGEIKRKYCGSKETTSESDEMGMSSLTIAEEEASEPGPEAEPRQSKEGNEAARLPSHVDAATEPMKPKHPRLVPIRMPSTSSGSDPFTSPDFASMEPQCSLPYLKTPNLSDEARKNFIGRLLHETENMEFLFSELMFKTRISLESSKVPLENLLDVLSPIESATVQSKEARCESWKKELTKAKRIIEVFTVLKPFTSFFNHEIIEQIIKCFGNEDDRQRLAAYKLAFTEFCKLSVCECPKDVYGKKTEEDGVITVKLKDDFDKYTVNAINKFRYKLCKILEVSEYDLRLINVTDGCTQMQFAVFMDLLPQMFPLSAEKIIKLKEERVILLKWKTDTEKHHNIEIISESPSVSERAQAPTTAHTQESTSFSQREEDFQNMVSTITCTLKQMGGFQTKFLADTVKDLVTLEPPAKSVDDFFDAIELHASSPMDFEIVALIIKILGKKGDRAMLAEYTKRYNIRLASASAASSKQEPPTVTELPLTSKDEFGTPTTPHLQPSQEPSAIKSRNDSKAHAKLEEFFGIIGYPHEVSKIAYKTEAATLEGGEYKWFCATVDVPGIGEVSGHLQCSESEAENSAAEKAFSELVLHSNDIGVLECPMCQNSMVGIEQRLTERCPRCDKLTLLPHNHIKPLPLSTEQKAYMHQHSSVQPATQHKRAMKRMLGKDTPQKQKRRVDRDNVSIEALQHRSRSIREHVDLMLGVYDYLHNGTVRYNTIQYNTTELPGKSGFKSTAVSPFHLADIESDVCLTVAKAEDNAALKVYMKLLSDERYGLFYHQTTNEPPKTYMKEKLKEYFSTSQEDLHYSTTIASHSLHTIIITIELQSTVGVPGIGAIEGERCLSEITAEESAACAAYLALTQRRCNEALATTSSKTH